jgi:hypothetical protein
MMGSGNPASKVHTNSRVALISGLNVFYAFCLQILER